MTGLLGFFFGDPLEHLSVVSMGLEPFFDAFVVFWLLGVVSDRAREARTNAATMRLYLFWLTVALALLRAFGVTTALLGVHHGLIATTPGLATMFGLMLGSMALYGLGLLIDRFGLPADYGIWFLFGIGGLLKGVRTVAIFISQDRYDPSLRGIVISYGIVAVLLLASTLIARDAVRTVSLFSLKGAKRKPKTVPVHFLIAGFFIPVVVAAEGINLLNLLLARFGGMTTVQARALGSFGNTNPWLSLAYVSAECVILVAACFFTTRLSSSLEGFAEAIAADGYRIAEVPPTSTPASYLTRLDFFLTIVAACWLAAVVILVPAIFSGVIGMSRPRLPVGGGPFVVTAIIFIEATRKLRSQTFQRQPRGSSGSLWVATPTTTRAIPANRTRRESLTSTTRRRRRHRAARGSGTPGRLEARRPRHHDVERDQHGSS